MSEFRPLFKVFGEFDPAGIDARRSAEQATRHVPTTDARFQGEMGLIPLATGYVNTSWTKVPLWVHGVAPPHGPSMLLVQESAAPSTVSGVPVEAGCLVAYGPSVPIEGRQGGAVRWTGLVLPEGSWREAARGADRVPLDLGAAPSVWRPEAGPLAELNAMLEAVVADARDRPDAFESEPFRLGHETRLAAAFLRAAEGAKRCAPTRLRGTRDRARQAVLDAISRIGGPPRVAVAEIAAELQVPRRSLERRFRETVGTAPAEFAHRTALAEARRLLLDPDSRASVAEIARAAGFAHLGRFSSYYRRAFGELPSETRRRSRAGAPTP